MVEFHLCFFVNSEVKKFDVAIVCCREDVVVFESSDALDVVCMGIAIGMHDFSGCHIEVSQDKVIAS